MIGRISIPSVYFLAKNTTWLGDDPMVWFTMMLMPVGPPAMMLSALMELKGAPEPDKMAVARVLTVSLTFRSLAPVIDTNLISIVLLCSYPDHLFRGCRLVESL